MKIVTLPGIEPEVNSTMEQLYFGTGIGVGSNLRSGNNGSLGDDAHPYYHFGGGIGASLWGDEPWAGYARWPNGIGIWQPENGYWDPENTYNHWLNPLTADDGYPIFFNPSNLKTSRNK